MTFTDIAEGDGAGIAFRRARSLAFDGIEALRQQSLVSRSRRPGGGGAIDAEHALRPLVSALVALVEER